MQYYILFKNARQLYRLSEQEAISDIINDFLEDPETEFIIFDPKTRKITATNEVLKKYYFHCVAGALDEVTHNDDFSAYEYLYHFRKSELYHYSLFNNDLYTLEDFDRFEWDRHEYNRHLSNLLYNAC